MTQAQLDRQTQLEQTSSDLTTHPLFRDYPIPFLATMDQNQTQPRTNSTNNTEQTEHEHASSKMHTPPIDTTTETPRPPKKRYEVLKDPLFLSSPVFSPKIPTKPSFSTNRDEHLTPLPSQDSFIFKSQLTSLYMFATDCTFCLYAKNEDFFTSFASNIMSPYQYWLDKGVKVFYLQSKFLHLSIYDLKTDNVILLFSQLLKKFLIIKHTLNFFNIQNHNYIFNI